MASRAINSFHRRVEEGQVLMSVLADVRQLVYVRDVEEEMCIRYFGDTIFTV